VPFILGPQGIVNAVDRNGSDPRIAVLSSGWGAGQTSTAIAIMQAKNDPAMNNIKLVILDNNTNRAGGGFWTTYWMFAPLLLTSAAPTPSDTDVPIVDVGYEYNINCCAPTDPTNVLADLNSLVAYAYSYGGQSTTPMPAEALEPVAPGAPHYHYIVAPDGTVADKILVKGNITYVTFQSDGLPLFRPVRMFPGGDVLADALEPTFTRLVNAGYQDGNPIPRDPGVTRPMGLLPPSPQTTAATTSAAPQTTVSSARSVVTGPSTSAAASSPVTTSPSSSNSTTASTNTVDMTTGNKVSPGTTTGTSSSRPSGAANPLQQAVTNLTSTLNGLVSGLTAGAPQGATTGPAGGTGNAGSAGSTSSTGSPSSTGASN
jgi:hypothetical protein